MNLKQTKVNILRSPSKLSDRAKTGVSLHCHTENSKEMLDFVPHYAEQLPIINFFWHRERDKYQEREGKGIDFSTAFWSPPMSGRQVYDGEKQQINNAGLEAIVSITDHDCIDSCLAVNETEPNSNAPISLEWTVPFEYGFFHVGVHNLPKDRAVELTKTLLDFTFNEERHTKEELTECFAMLNNLPEVLVVLNHPLWDIELVGKERHLELLKHFIRTHGRWIHAFEINGFRSWSENKRVIELAEVLGFPLVTGGDRHGCKPNTVVNLTNASTFAEFAEEIRVDKRSEVVLMPEYERPLHSRQLQSFAEILRHYPMGELHRQKWFQRVHFDVGDGNGLRSLADHGWTRGGPAWLRVAIFVLGVLGSPAARPAFRLARKKRDRVPRNIEATMFEAPDVEEIIGEMSSEPAS